MATVLLTFSIAPTRIATMREVYSAHSTRTQIPSLSVSIKDWHSSGPFFGGAPRISTSHSARGSPRRHTHEQGRRAPQAPMFYIAILTFPRISTILSNPTPPQTLSLGQL